MKKYALILGLILISSGAVFARCCDCCSRYDCNAYPPPPPPPAPYMTGGYGHVPLIYQPKSVVSVSIGNRVRGHGMARGGYHHHHGSNFGASIRLSI